MESPESGSILHLSHLGLQVSLWRVDLCALAQDGCVMVDAEVLRVGVRGSQRVRLVKLARKLGLLMIVFLDDLLERTLEKESTGG